MYCDVGLQLILNVKNLCLAPEGDFTNYRYVSNSPILLWPWGSHRAGNVLHITVNTTDHLLVGTCLSREEGRPHMNTPRDPGTAVAPGKLWNKALVWTAVYQLHPQHYTMWFYSKQYRVDVCVLLMWVSFKRVWFLSVCVSGGVPFDSAFIYTSSDRKQHISGLFQGNEN